MQEFLAQHYDWLRALHLIAVMSWMAGMLYLPRLFVYHAACAHGSPQSGTFKVMERRLLKIIINPAMIAAWVFGLSMLYANPGLLEGRVWMHVKLFLVLMMSALHGVFVRTVKIFARDENTRSPRYYSILNELPALLMVLIVILAVVEPF